MNAGGKEYAMALFSIALENEKTDQVFSDLGFIGKLLRENPGYIDYLTDPGIPRSERAESLEKIFEDEVCEDVLSLTGVLFDHGDMRSIFSVIDEYNGLYENYRKLAVAVITSAVELTEDQKTRLIRKLEASTGKTIKAEYHIDPDLIGGISVTVDGRYYDGSVRHNLSNLKEVIS